MSQTIVADASPQAGTKKSPGVQLLTLLTFQVGGQTYGLPVANVVRIIEMVTITPLPGAPEPIEGIINLRGKAVSVIDLRRRFGLPRQAYGLHTPIILADMEGGDPRATPVGLVVDTVERVLDIPPEDLAITDAIVPPELVKQMAAQAACGGVAGVANVERQMIPVLDVRALLTSTEQIELAQALGRKTPALEIG
ncbi:MAG: chemotaxis protein CheW [Chloroflexota bacterium]